MLRSVECDAVIVDDQGFDAPSLHHQGAGGGQGRHHRKADDGRRREVPAILEAEAKSSGRVRVTFNYRFAPYMTRVKELLKEGVIGRVHSVDFAVVFGHDPRRRLLPPLAPAKGKLGRPFCPQGDCTTSTWSTGGWTQEPVRVYAVGSRTFTDRPVPERGERCLDCQYEATCEFHVDLAAKQGRERSSYLGGGVRRRLPPGRLRLQPRDRHRGYHGGDRQLQRGSASCTTASIPLCPLRGGGCAFNGTKGRWRRGSASGTLSRSVPRWASGPRWAEGSIRGGSAQGDIEVKGVGGDPDLPAVWRRVKTIKVPHGGSGHGGGDVAPAGHALSGADVPDPLNHLAGSRAGAMSILTGVAANRSMALGMPGNQPLRATQPRWERSRCRDGTAKIRGRRGRERHGAAIDAVPSRLCQPGPAGPSVGGLGPGGRGGGGGRGRHRPRPCWPKWARRWAFGRAPFSFGARGAWKRSGPKRSSSCTPNRTHAGTGPGGP